MTVDDSVNMSSQERLSESVEGLPSASASQPERAQGTGLDETADQAE
jgi:hypothetical protein